MYTEDELLVITRKVDNLAYENPRVANSELSEYLVVVVSILYGKQWYV